MSARPFPAPRLALSLLLVLSCSGTRATAGFLDPSGYTYQYVTGARFISGLSLGNDGVVAGNDIFVPDQPAPAGFIFVNGQLHFLADLTRWSGTAGSIGEMSAHGSGGLIGGTGFVAGRPQFTYTYNYYTGQFAATPDPFFATVPPPPDGFVTAFPPPYADPSAGGPGLAGSGLDVSQFTVVAQNDRGQLLVISPQAPPGSPDAFPQSAYLLTPVPEPAGLALLGIGTACLLGYGWLRQRPARTVKTDEAGAGGPRPGPGPFPRSETAGG